MKKILALAFVTMLVFPAISSAGFWDSVGSALGHAIGSAITGNNGNHGPSHGPGHGPGHNPGHPGGGNGHGFPPPPPVNHQLNEAVRQVQYLLNNAAASFGPHMGHNGGQGIARTLGEAERRLRDVARFAPPRFGREIGEVVRLVQGARYAMVTEHDFRRAHEMTRRAQGQFDRIAFTLVH